MPLDTFFTVTNIVLAIALIMAILLQNRGAGLGSTFGGDSAMYHTKRGLEKRLHQATIVLSALFLLGAVLQVIF